MHTGENIVNQYGVLAALGFVIGGAMTLLWELKAGPAGEPAGAEAVSPGSDDGTVARSVERVASPAFSSRHQARPDRRGGAARVGQAAAPVRMSEIGGATAAEARGAQAASAQDRTASEPVSRASPTSAATSATTHVSEADRAVAIRIHRILVGGQLVSGGILDESTLERYGREKKYLVYFDLSVTAEAGGPALRVEQQDFRLEDSVGTIYPPVELKSGLSAVLQQGQTVRGGVVYALHNDGAPARLHFRTRDQTFAPLPDSIFEPGRGG